MAIYLELANLIVNKDAIRNKYKGGIIAFRRKYLKDHKNRNQEDHFLFSISRLNADEFDIDDLVDNGLFYDSKLHRSDDFVILNRLQGLLWKVDWIDSNPVFAWHTNAGPKEKAEVDRISNMPFDKIIELNQQGQNLLSTIIISE